MGSKRRLVEHQSWKHYKPALSFMAGNVDSLKLLFRVASIRTFKRSNASHQAILDDVEGTIADGTIAMMRHIQNNSAKSRSEQKASLWRDKLRSDFGTYLRTSVLDENMFAPYGIRSCEDVDHCILRLPFATFTTFEMPPMA
jgi:hypothetical protein